MLLINVLDVAAYCLLVEFDVDNRHEATDSKKAHLRGLRLHNQQQAPFYCTQATINFLLTSAACSLCDYVSKRTDRLNRHKACRGAKGKFKCAQRKQQQGATYRELRTQPPQTVVKQSVLVVWGFLP